MYNDFPNIFDSDTVQKLKARFYLLDEATMPTWGVMSCPQMLAHTNVTYEMMYEDKHPKPSFMTSLLLKWFVKPAVCGPKPYMKNGPTAQAFKITDEKNFDVEKERLFNYLDKTQKLGLDHFVLKPSHSFGMLTAQEWNTMLYKHLDHHLTQFGV